MKRNAPIERSAATCARKRQHKTRDIAIAAALGTIRGGLAGMNPGDFVYRCQFCRQWHVGNPSGRDLKAKYRGERIRREKVGAAP